jgi:serine protease
MMRASLPILALCAALCAPLTLQAPTAHAATAAPEAAVPDASDTARVVVRFRADSPLLRRQAMAATPAAEHAERARALGTRLGRVMRAGGAVDGRTQVVLADGVTSEQLAAELSAQTDVELALVDQRRRITAAPNDPLYTSGGAAGPAAGQWYLKPPTTTGQVSSIDAESAWDITTGSPSVVVAVLDTGVRFDHPDLGGNLLPGYDFIHDPLTANDGDGRDPDASDPGDWVSQADKNANPAAFAGCDIESSSWHGTQTASLIGALTNNGTGMASVGRTVRVLPVRVLGKCGGFDSDITAAIQWAAGVSIPGVPDNQTPAKVINLSLGGAGTCSQLYIDAVAAANARGAVVVASAGNSEGHAVSVPANCPGVIAVGGLRNVGSKVGFSDLGPEVAISAPGGNCVNASGDCLFPIITATNTGTQGPAASTYSSGTNPSFGTSFSAPLVAGTAALMFAVQPSLTPADVKAKLQGAARPFPTTGGTAGTLQCVAPQANVNQDECYCTTSTCGAGMLDAGKAVLAAAGVQARIDESPAGPQPGTQITLSAAGSLVASGRTIASYQWTLVNGGGIVTVFDGPTNGATAAVTPTNAGSFAVGLTVTDSQGSSSTTQATVTVGTQPSSAGGGGGGGGGGGALGVPWLLLLAAAIPLIAATRRREH